MEIESGKRLNASFFRRMVGERVLRERRWTSAGATPRALVRSARELREAKHNFGGHRDAAIKDLTYAIEQVERCIEHAR